MHHPRAPQPWRYWGWRAAPAPCRVSCSMESNPYGTKPDIGQLHNGVPDLCGQRLVEEVPWGWSRHAGSSRYGLRAHTSVISYTGTMPLGSFHNGWQEDHYNPYNAGYDWDDTPYQMSPLIRQQEEQKYIPPQEIPDFDQQPLTAVGKSCPLVDGLLARREETKPMKQWTQNEVMDWLCEEARKCNIECEKVYWHNFYGVDGCTLVKMNPHEFIEKDPHHGGFLFAAVERQRANEENCRDDNLPSFKHIRQPDDVIYTDLSESLGCRNVLSDNDSYISDASSHEAPDIKPLDIVPKPVGHPGGRRPVGRPPKPTRAKRGNKEKKTGRLWEFIRDLLLKPEYCPSLICWENHEEGVFRFVRSDKVAELWGTIKDNPKMTYEKLSRAMRYYYKSQVLQPVLGRRLVYKFGPTAKGWRTNNPNFRDSTK